jgi:hypothetical protein
LAECSFIMGYPFKIVIVFVLVDEISFFRRASHDHEHALAIAASIALRA